MGLITSTQSVSRYTVDGHIENPAVENIRNSLKKYSIPVIESEFDEIVSGWTPFESPYDPDFDKFSFQFGTYFVFNLRIDKKSIPAKLLQKHMAMEIAKRIEKSGRDFISKNEKSEIKDRVIDLLMRKIPSVPSIYEILWDYEEKNIYFHTTQKAANELFETLFLKTFNLKAIRLFPYTMIERKSGFSSRQKDLFAGLTPLKYSR